MSLRLWGKQARAGGGRTEQSLEILRSGGEEDLQNEREAAPWNEGEVWTKAWSWGLRGVSRGWTTRGAPGELWGFLPSGVDAGELRTGEGHSVLSHPFSPRPAQQGPNLNSSR